MEISVEGSEKSKNRKDHVTQLHHTRVYAPKSMSYTMLGYMPLNPCPILQREICIILLIVSIVTTVKK